MKNFILYKHTFPNGKVYIGITSKETAELRWRGGRGYQTQTLLANAIKEFGWENIQHEILYKNIPEEEISALEQAVIKEYKANCRDYGYNILEGGLDGYVRVGQSVLMYDLNGNFVRSFLTILDACDFLGVGQGGSISAACQGKRVSMYGYQWRFYQEDYPIKIEAVDLASSRRVKQIKQYTKDGEYIQTFSSIVEASKATGAGGPDIGKVCAGKRKSAGGYCWRYADDEDYLLNR